MDIALNSDFSVYLDDRNDLATVDGLAEFEQSVVMTLTDLMQNSFSDINRSTIEQKLRQKVTRVARVHGDIESIDSINIYPHADKSGVYVVEVTYIYDREAFLTEVQS